MKIPTSAQQTIPVVDMSQPNKRWREIVHELKNALQYTGFVYLINHGIPEEIVNGAFESSKDFFGLPLDEKIKFERDLQDTFHGYTKPGLKVVNPKSKICMKELRESFDCNIYNSSGCPYPDASACNFKPAMHTLANECKGLAKTILKMLADALNLVEQDYFLRHHQCLWDESVPNYTSLRSLFYPQIKEDISGAIRFDEHTDYGTFTLLFQDSIGGLEVKNSEGEWIPATPIPGSIVVNTGDLLNAWSGGLYASTFHRVIVPSDEYRQQRPRQSIAFFVKPDNATYVVPLVNPENKENNKKEAPEFQNVTAGEHFRQRTMSTRKEQVIKQ